MSLILFLSVFSLTNCKAKENSLPEKNNNNSNDTIYVFQSVFDSLKSKGVDSNFIKKYLHAPSLKFDGKYIKINVTGYLKSTDYSFLYSNKSVEQSQEFLNKNLSILTKAEKKYGVPKEIIVAILKIETKFGEVLGNNHLPSVFFSTALVNEQQFIDVNNKVVDELSDSSNKVELKQKVIQRSKKKSSWAIKELISISKIEQRYGIDFNKINGSWAGAFGIPQFLPSSFLMSAVDGNEDGVIDLFDLEDAIFSVGNYLNRYKFDTFENKKKAVYSYNNSKSYSEAVVKLSEKLKTKE
jgi:membrane-bound lytic murein transglycosylase B